MDKHLVPGDPVLVEKIVNHLKAKGIFDEFRHECLADVDTKSSCQNLSQRVDGYTTKFLANETWNPDLNKNELRNKLRRHIDESGMLAVGADHVVEQVINPKIHQLFLPKIIEVVHQYVQQEAEKLTKKDVPESTKSGKTPMEKFDKPKPVILDPIADILSFTYSKPKQSVQTSSSVQNKAVDQVKSEKKKEEIALQAKSAENVKSEKKKEDITSEKVQDISLKVKKEEISLPSKPLTTATLNAEKKEEVSDSSVKITPPESSDESSQSALPQSKATELKIKKEIKSEEVDTSVEGQKKPKEEPKIEKKKGEESKVSKLEGSSHSDETVSQKPNTGSSKSGSTHSKSKSEAEKKKVKSHSQHKPSSLSDPNKVKTKDSSSSSSSTSKPSSEKHIKSSSSKHSKSSKDSSPLKGSSSKQPKSEKEDGSKSKAVEAQTKSPDITGKKNVPSKPNSDRKEGVPSKIKQSSDKHEKQKSVKVHSLHREHSVEKVKKSAHYSSSYDSSQGSDVDKSSTSSVGTKEKQKHFSKHHKKDKNRDGSKSSSRDPKEQSSDKKRFHHDSDSGADQKLKSGKCLSKNTTEKHKKSSVQTSAKIDSRSNSLGSTSSTSDSQNSSSKDNILTLSEDTSDAVPKSTGKKKKPAGKESERCKDVKNLPPPPPPPPTTSLGFGTPSSADVSSMDETQSSQDSEFEDYSSDAESSSDSEEEKEEVVVKKNSKSSGPKSLYDIFMRSSSSSEFEGFQSSPEKGPGPDKSNVLDASTSSVNTSDLSSFDDEISHTEDSDSETEDKKVKRKLTLKEAENLLRIKAEKRRSSLKNVTSERMNSEGKSSNSSLHCSVASSEEDLSQRPEPKRESRRERKLNPKYASSEYTSIFNSKRTSFITKQTNPSDQASPLPSPERSSDLKKNEADSKKAKEKSSSSRRNLFSSSSEPKISSKLDIDNEFEVPVTPTCSFNTMSPAFNSASSDGQVTLPMDKKNGSDGETPSRIALKIKMSASKNDNQMNTEKMTKSVKRKYDGETPSAKRPCNKVIPAENVANENEPLNNKTSKSGVVLSVEQKEFYQKQKGSNKGDVLNNIEHAKNSFPNNNHVADSNSND